MNYENTNDRELWESCLKSDEGAYNELFNRYFPRMSRIAARYVKDTMQAEELVMDCFINLWDKRLRIRIEGDFSNYLFGCLHHAVLSHFRRKLPTMVGIEEAENRYETASPTDAPLLSAELHRSYTAALEKLTPRRREIFLMRREQELSYAEIARLARVSESAVKNSMSAALNGLRGHLKGSVSAIALAILSLF